MGHYHMIPSEKLSPLAVERLTYMATMLREIHADEQKKAAFRMDWLALPEDNICGFAGCAIGHAGFDTQFNEWGFKGFFTAGGKIVDFVNEHFSDRKNYVEGTFTKMGDVLDVDSRTMDYLFESSWFGDSRRRETPLDVASRIEHFIKENS